MVCVQCTYSVLYTYTTFFSLYSYVYSVPVPVLDLYCTLLPQGDFLTGEHNKTIAESTIVFVNNFAFGPEVFIPYIPHPTP